MRAASRFDAGADESDHFVEMVEGFEITFEDMGSRLGFHQLKTGPAADHFDPVVDPGER